MNDYFWTPMKGLLIGTFVLVVGAALWFGYWQLHESSVNRENDILQRGHPMQNGDIAQDRDLAHDWLTADPGQKKFIANEFCATLQNVTQVPADLEQDKTQICTP